MPLTPYSRLYNIEICVIVIKSTTLTIMNKKGFCKNCGEQIGDDSNSNEFCSEQCGVEYRLEHK